MRGLMMDAPLLVSGIIEHAAAVHGSTEIVARTVEGDLHRYTYATARDRCKRLAKALLALGIGDGDRVGSLAWNTHHHFELFYGVSGMGAVLHTINPRLHDDTLVFIVNHAEDRWICVDAATLAIAERIAPRLPAVRGWIYMSAQAATPPTSLPHLLAYESLLAAQDGDHGWPLLDERRACTICYTSGTTGAPKGVVYSHRSMIIGALLMSTADMVGGYRSGAREAVMPIAPLFHANGWQMPYTAPMNGHKLVLPGRNFEPEKLHELMTTEQVTIAAAVPTVWLLLIDFLEARRLRLEPLRAAMVAGTKAPRSMIEALERFGVVVGQCWGMTEAPGVVKTTLPPGTIEQPAEVQMALKLRQGRIGYGTELRIVDDAGQTLPPDGEAIGHLQARGPVVAAAYYKQEAPLMDGWLVTGDVARIFRDGSIEIVDRSKDVIKSGGEWISSVAVENAALDHPSVQHAAVIAMEHPRWQERPLLIAVLKPGARVSRDELLDHLRPRIARWWLPDEVVFVDALPLTATGKVQKTLLRERYRRLGAGGAVATSLADGGGLSKSSGRTL
ncbi:MAG: long-chain fatty acid--CoA ligase [Stellaceae bacterium]